MLALIGKQQGVPASKVNFVAFSGAEVVTTLAAGKLTAAISGISELKPQADAGRIRLIAVSSEKRVPGVNTPTLKEQGVNVVIGNWRGVVGAPGMSAAGRKTWLERLDKLAKTKEWKDGLAKQGLEDAYLSGDKFVAFLNDEKKRWATSLADLGLAK
jgi:putative tricarboxylic transport membrane protein